MEELKELLKQIGLPSVAIPAALIATLIAVFFLKRTLKQRDERGKTNYKSWREYARLQEKAMLEAYRMLYEQVNLTTLTPTEFQKIICRADDLIMDPFSEYRAHLPKPIEDRVYGLHNIVAQFKPDPTFPCEVTPKAIENLFMYRQRFYKEVEAISNLICKST